MKSGSLVAASKDRGPYTRVVNQIFFHTTGGNSGSWIAASGYIGIYTLWCEPNFFSHHRWDFVRRAQSGSWIPACRVRELYTHSVNINYNSHWGCDIVNSNFSPHGLIARRWGTVVTIRYSIKIDTIYENQKEYKFYCWI